MTVCFECSRVSGEKKEKLELLVSLETLCLSCHTELLLVVTANASQGNPLLTAFCQKTETIKTLKQAEFSRKCSLLIICEKTDFPNQKRVLHSTSVYSYSLKCTQPIDNIMLILGYIFKLRWLFPSVF